MNIRKTIIVSALAMFAAAPAIAGGTTTPTHVHYCGCGDAGWTPGTNPNCGTSSSTTTSSTGGTTTSSTGGTTTSSTGGTTTSSTGGTSGGSTGGTNVPEPADFALFALGVGGLLIGRRTAKKRAQAAE